MPDLADCLWRGHVTINQARAELGLPPFQIPEADLLISQLAESDE